MKTTTNLIKITALLTATLLTACASSPGPVGAIGRSDARTLAGARATHQGSTTTDRYYDPVSQDWVLANN